MIKKKALILFTKNPELGKVKTRLAKTIGNENALEIYKNLLQHTKEIALKVNADKFLFYSNEINQIDQWENAIFNKKLQSGDDLGIRMKTAFSEVFALGYTSVCIIGSDCYELNSEIVTAAFDSLEKNDFVVGPTFDGGYYLLGMNKINNRVFEEVSWSTETVFETTISRINETKSSVFILEKLTDIDEEKDLPEIWKIKM
jgi:rSAM/selenodomain-associated transferase 1